MYRSSRVDLIAASVLLSGLLTACGEAPPSPPSLLLITVDTTRADHLSCYGYDQPTSPNIDALAAEGVRFERAFSHAPITLPSHTSIMTGVFPVYHGVRDNGGFVVRQDLDTLAEMMAGAGYRTAAFVSAFVLDSRFGLDQGFELYEDNYAESWSEENLRDRKLYNQMVVDRPANQTTDKALAWLEAHASEPFFLWVHFYDPHQRYAPPPPFDLRYPDSPYDGEIAFMDSQIGRLFAALRDQGRWDNTLVTLTGDHGEGLGQHAEQTHAILTYDATLHIPLILKPPAAAGGEVAGPRVVAERVSHVDLLPTLLELLDVPASGVRHGRSLVPLLSGGQVSPRPSYFETNLPRFGFGWASLFGLREGDWKYIHAPQPELYQLDEDPGEIYNLAASHPERLEAMENSLFAMLARASAPPTESSGLDLETRRALEALGYAGGGGHGEADLNPRVPDGRRSPVDGLTLLNDYYTARTMASRGQFREAVQVFEEALVPLDPENPGFLRQLANFKRRLGNPAAARRLLERAQALDPEDIEILVELGQLELDAERFEAADALFSAVCELMPENLHAAYLRALMAARAGRVEVAIERYQAALEIDPSHFDARVNLGVELAKAGRSAEAEEAFNTALESQPFAPRVHYNLGLVQLRDGRVGAATHAFETALRYREGYPEARLGLAMARLEAGEAAAGRALLEELVAEAPETTAAQTAATVLRGMS